MREHVRMPRHRVMTPLRWSDTDAYGHINNVQFLRLLEEARVVALSDVAPRSGPPGSGVAGSGVAGTALLVARSEIEYLEPMLFRIEPIAIDLWVTRIGAADFDMAYEFLDQTLDGAGTGQIYAHAETLLVAFDQVTQRPRRISATERERLESWRDEPVQWRRRRAPR
jgi:acyl-CoA thioester hydrolase